MAGQALMNPLIRGILRNDDQLEMTSRIVAVKHLGGDASLAHVVFFHLYFKQLHNLISTGKAHSIHLPGS